jgi:hypothetical protein
LRPSHEEAHEYYVKAFAELEAQKRKMKREGSKVELIKNKDDENPSASGDKPLYDPSKVSSDQCAPNKDTHKGEP